MIFNICKPNIPCNYCDLSHHHGTKLRFSWMVRVMCGDYVVTDVCCSGKKEDHPPTTYFSFFLLHQGMYRSNINKLLKITTSNPSLFGKQSIKFYTSTAGRKGLMNVTMSSLKSSPILMNSMNRFYSKTTILANTQNYEFQAETRKLLDIVTHSIYTDKEVFLRELISNASDSLEKLRYLQTTGNSPALSDDSPLEINIDIDGEKKTITISDNGIGMTKDELISNLGTIARSGSKQFVEKIQSSSAASSRDGDGIIGQFGVGFYSSFMVSDRVTVDSLSADSQDKVAHSWESDGSGTFTVKEVAANRGSKLTLHLKESCHEFCDPKKIKEIIKKYSNFVAFPIKVDGVVVNTISAIWTQDKNSVTEQQYNDFYKYIANAFDKPKYVLHFKADAPLDLKALLFFPMLHTEKFGMGRMEPGQHLSSNSSSFRQV